MAVGDRRPWRYRTAIDGNWLTFVLFKFVFAHCLVVTVVLQQQQQLLPRLLRCHCHSNSYLMLLLFFAIVIVKANQIVCTLTVAFATAAAPVAIEHSLPSLRSCFANNFN